MSGYEIVFGPGVIVDGGLFGGSGTDTAFCPAGKKVVGGGWKTDPPKGSALFNYPNSDHSWIVTLFVGGAQGSTLMNAYAICVNVS